jgi:hypothetical protein
MSYSHIKDKLGIKSGSSVRFKIVEGKCNVEKEMEDNKMDKHIGYLKSQNRIDGLIEELRGKIKDTDLAESK